MRWTVSLALGFAAPSLFAASSASVAPPSVALTWLMAVLALSLGALLWRARGQLHDKSQEVAHLAKAHAQATAKGKGALQQQLEASRAALKASEVALAVQKKKNFQHIALLQAAQHEAEEAGRRANASIEAAKRAQRDAEAVRRQQPSRSKSQDVGAMTARAAEPEIKAEPEAHLTEAAAPSVAQVEAARPAPSPSDEENALTQALFAAEAARAANEAKNLELQAALKEARRQLGRKDKRLEDLRRLDLMSRGKIEVLEDKLKRLGRELYENISALAQLRGEVGPVPGPKKARAQGATPPQAARPNQVAAQAARGAQAPAPELLSEPAEQAERALRPAHMPPPKGPTPQASTPSAP